MLFYGTNIVLFQRSRVLSSAPQFAWGINWMVLTLPEWILIACQLFQAEDTRGLSRSHTVAEGHTHKYRSRNETWSSLPWSSGLKSILESSAITPEPTFSKRFHLYFLTGLFVYRGFCVIHPTNVQIAVKASKSQAGRSARAFRILLI